MNNELCKYGKVIKSGTRIYFLCQIYNFNCGMCRWCVEDQVFKMLPDWQNKCKFIKNGEVK